MRNTPWYRNGSPQAARHNPSRGSILHGRFGDGGGALRKGTVAEGELGIAGHIHGVVVLSYE